MVSIVIVTHSNKLAEGILDEIRIMAKNIPVALAGGDDDNNYGTSYTKIRNAIESVYSKDGVIVLTDIGSSTMTSEIVIEDLNKDNILLFDGPIVESAITASVSSECGNDINAIKEELIKTKSN